MEADNKSKFVYTMPELLSPVGNWACLQAAIDNGADAVYLGSREFNARINARNFSLNELSKVISHSHDRGVRVYLTMNTLVKNHELRRFFGVISSAYSMSVDGVIIQHISFLDLIKANYPGLKVFISTQAAIGNAGSANLLKSADRIILPRELPLEEIKRIIDLGIQVEVFVHGALCFSYSGLCLFSSFVGNRSGNRGSCAQLCRQRYDGSYPLSTKELCLVRRIPELIQAGVTGFKIEGRMRSPLYVAVATRLYRKAIDSFVAGSFEVPEKEIGEIEVVFSREFTEGFTFNKEDLISPEKPMNRGALLGTIENGEITLQHSVDVGDGVGIWGEDRVTGGTIQNIVCAGRKVNAASAGNKVDLGIQVKNGSTIYLTSSTQISLKPDFTSKKSSIVTMQRKHIQVHLPKIVSRKAVNSMLLVKVYSVVEARESSQAGADVVFYNICSPDFPENRDWQEHALLGAYIPRIMNDAELSQSFELLKQKKPSALLAGNLGFLTRRKEYDFPVFLDYSLGAFNDMDLLFFQKFNVIPILSLELSLKEMIDFKNKDVAVFCHGDVVVANTLIPLQLNVLVGDKRLSFKVRKENGCWQILNGRPFGMFNDVRKLSSAGFTQFFIDKDGEGAHFMSLYSRILKHEIADRRLRKGYTAGHLYRPVL
jgi:collagenase-like PrtC family protease